MKSRVVWFIILALASLALSSCGCDSSSPPVKASFSTPTGTGYLRKSDTLWILNLEGSYADMGRQYGALLKNELGTLFTHMDAAIGYNAPATTLTLNLVKKEMDSREMQMLTGLAMESGLDFDKLEFLNASLFFMYDVGCSAFAATGSQTVSGFTIAGRNFDNPRPKYSQILSGNSILVIYNPKNQFTGNGAHRDNSVAVMTQIGWLYGLTNLNSKGIYLEYNNATNSIPIDKTKIGQIMNGLHQNLYASFDSDSLEDLDLKLSGPALVATMTQVADKNRVWHYERSPYEPAKKIRAGDAKGAYFYDNPPDMDIFTNHFFNDSWLHQRFIYTSPANDSGSRTFARLVNLQNLARQAAGKITPEKMKEIMTTRLLADGSGGPFIAWGLDNPDVTHFTSVTDIANTVMHIYPHVDAMLYPDPSALQWTAIALAGEFR